MTAEKPRHPLRDTVPPPTIPAPQRPRSAIPRRTRRAGALLVIACLLAVAGSVLPWLTAVNVSPSDGHRSEMFTWSAWNTRCGLLFPLFAFPFLLFKLSRAGLDAVRGVAPKLRRQQALLLSLAGCASVVVFSVLMVLGAVGGAFNTYWNRGSRTEFVTGSGFFVSLVGYALASIASLLLPATSGE